jgi:hypothetical protein
MPLDGQVDVQLIIGRGHDNLAEGCEISGAEFGISFQMQDGLCLQDLSFRSTRQVNFGPDGRISAPAHAIYGADGEDIAGLRSGNITIRRVRALNDNIGTTAFKVRGADAVTVEDASCEFFGGIFSFAEIGEVNVRRFEARHCRSSIPDRILWGTAVQDVDNLRMVAGRIELAALSAPAKNGNVLLGIGYTGRTRDVRPEISVIDFKATITGALKDPVRVDAVRLSGDALARSGARATLHGLTLMSEHARRGLVGLRVSDAAEVELSDSSITGFPIAVVLGSTAGKFTASNTSLRPQDVVDRRAGRRR